MSKSQHTEAQMIGALKQLEAWQKAEGAREVGILKRTTYAWKATHNRRMWGRRQEAKQLGLRTRSHESWLRTKTLEVSRGIRVSRIVPKCLIKPLQRFRRFSTRARAQRVWESPLFDNFNRLADGWPTQARFWLEWAARPNYLENP